jgi:hypothetical protein
MTSTELWSENDVLRQRLNELRVRLDREHEEKLRLKAENLWLKRLIEESRRAPVAPPAIDNVTRIF